jgi:predicted HTH transcriptional regulator
VLRQLDADAFFALAREPKPAAGAQVLRAFLQSGFIREDMEGGYDITNLGAILFARNIADFASVASKSVRVVRYYGNDKRRSGKEIVGSFGYAIGFAGLVDYVLKQLPGEDKFDGAVRVWRPAVPQIAIREVIANALIHQDFTISGVGPVVEIYDDRVEVTNPGNSLIDIDRIIDERRSRNEELAKTMRSLGLCEERGGGIDKAILAIEDMSLPAPEFFPSADSMRVALHGPRPFGSLSRAERVWACFCHCVVRWLKDDYMNNTSLRARFSLPVEDYQAVSAVIANARTEGRIVQAELNQGNKNARYVPYWARPWK